MNPIHVGIDYTEALEGKKSLLALEMDFLRLSRIIREFHILRNRELILKNKLRLSFASLKNNLVETQNALPETPEAKKLDLKSKQKKSKIREKYSKGIEFQLQEIKEKLASLG